MEQRTFKFGSSFFALLLYLFNPLTLAMGHYATPDMGSAFAFTLAPYLFWRFYSKPSNNNLIFAGISLGIALLSRFSSLSLIIIFAFWLICKAFKEKNILNNLKKFVFILLISILVLWLGYGAPLTFVPKPNEKSTAITIGANNNLYNRIFHQYAHYIIPPHFFKGFIINTYLVNHGLMAYIDSRYSDNGWWYYFPFAFLYKTPIYIFVFIIILIGLFIKSPKKYFHEKNLYLISIALLFFILACFSKMNLGIRYILPVYVTLFILLGQIITVKEKLYHSIIWGILCISIIYIMWQISPKYLTYFNEIAGGPRNGWQHLIDSNIDWGQDVYRLKDFLLKNHIQKIYVDYVWKKEPLDYNKINYTIFDKNKNTSGHLAINASALPANKWLFDENCKLLSRLGNSLYIFDLGNCKR